MRTIWGYIVLAICIALYTISSVHNWTKQLTIIKVSSNSAFASDRERYGDLYGMSYLSYFRKTYSNPKIIPPRKYGKLDIDLYAVCDSYLWSFANTPDFYQRVDRLSLAKTNARQTLKPKLDTAKNVLLLELSERNVLVLLQDTDYLKNLLSSPRDKKNTAKKSKGTLTILNKTSEAVADVLFNSMINDNIESNIWDYRFLTPVKELKADLNYNLFGKVDNNVYLSGSKRQLFLAQTIDTTKLTSAFIHISDKKIESMVNNLNKLYGKAMKLGFDKVYLTIVPNPVSIIEPDFNNWKYNRVTQRVQSSPQLQVPFIDLFYDYKNAHQPVYYASDSHWNWKGVQIWLNKFNAELKKIPAKDRRRESKHT